jgi:predicted nuclease of predicted toxin-antitoxin system
MRGLMFVLTKLILKSKSLKMKRIKNMPQLYGDENFPRPVVDELRRLGHDVVNIQDTGKSQQGVSDEAIMAFAIAEERAVLTINRKHFIRLHHLQPEHAGIIVCTFDPNFVGQAIRIHEEIKFKASLFDQLIRVNRPVL